MLYLFLIFQIGVLLRVLYLEMTKMPLPWLCQSHACLTTCKTAAAHQAAAATPHPPSNWETKKQQHPKPKVRTHLPYVLRATYRSGLAGGGSWSTAPAATPGATSAHSGLRPVRCARTATRTFWRGRRGRILWLEVMTGAPSRWEAATGGRADSNLTPQSAAALHR